MSAMKNRPLTRTLIAAAALAAAAGLAQAESWNTPHRAGEASTLTHGVPNAVTTNSPYGHHGQALVVSQPAVVAVAPVQQTWYYPAGVQTHVLGAGPAWHPHGSETFESRGSPETANVPLRAGEASTMTGGAPNMSTNNTAGHGHTVTTITSYGPYLLQSHSGPVYYYP